MYHKDDLIVGFNLLDCQIIKIEGNEYTLECVHCHKLYKYDYDKLRRRKTNFCKCTYDWTKNIKEDLTNKIFGDIIVDSLDVDNERRELSKQKYGKYIVYWKCHCTKCGNESYKSANDLKGITKRNASGCNVCFGDNIVGKKFGRLTVLNNHKSENGMILWECECDCDKHTHIWVDKGRLNSGNTQSCGCIRCEKLIQWNKDYLENYIPHSVKEEYPRLYNTYIGMKMRCLNPNNTHYNSYGGRGITICDEWLNSFNSFKEWAFENGYEENLTIDRINVNGNYEPNNCRWTDMKIQANNKTNNKYLEYQGRVQTLSQWCEELGLDYYRTKARLNTCGMTVEQAFNKNYYKNDGSKKLNKNIVYKLKGE